MVIDLPYTLFLWLLEHYSMKMFFNSQYPYVTQISNKRTFQSKTVLTIVAVNHQLSERHTIIQYIYYESSVKLCSSQKPGTQELRLRLMF